MLKPDSEDVKVLDLQRLSRMSHTCIQIIESCFEFIVQRDEARSQFVIQRTEAGFNFVCKIHLQPESVVSIFSWKLNHNGSCD